MDFTFAFLLPIILWQTYNKIPMCHSSQSSYVWQTNNNKIQVVCHSSQSYYVWQTNNKIKVLCHSQSYYDQQQNSGVVSS